MPVNCIYHVYQRTAEQLSVINGVMNVELPPERGDHAC